MRYFLQLSYDGTNYHGWQTQPNADTVQAHIDQALQTLLRHPVPTTGAGRTDTGVHAAMMVAHFDHPEPLDTQDTARRLTLMLPQDIAVQQVVPVPDTAHARFSALSRTYHYDILLQKDPFRRHFATRIHYSLDFRQMNQAAALLLGTHDFSSFCKAGTDTKTNLCTLTQARWQQTGPHTWRFTVTADRFLRNMVRAIVGTLFTIGTRRTSPEAITRILTLASRSAAGESAPAEGLTLAHIAYPQDIFTPI